MDFIAEAIKVAKRSRLIKHRTGAVIVMKGKIVSNGWSHVPAYKPLGDLRSLHAEIHALARCRHIELRNATCYVATLTRIDRITLAQPCLNCAIALQSAGVTTARFTVTQQDNKPHSQHVSLQGQLKGFKVYVPHS